MHLGEWVDSNGQKEIQRSKVCAEGIVSPNKAARTLQNSTLFLSMRTGLGDYDSYRFLK